jgi:acyl-CoA reductase-like NAD-dependent aldehyde dehydrogenase
MRFKDNGKFNTVYGKTLIGFHLIQGQPCGGTASFNSYNPAHWQDRVGLFPQATTREWQHALHPPPQRLWFSESQRHQTFARLHQGLATEMAFFTRLYIRESGQPLKWVQQELQLLLAQLAALAEGTPSFNPHPEKPGYHLLCSESPVSFAQVGTLLLNTLYAGHPVIWLPCRQSSASAWLFSHLCRQAGFPAPALQLLHGRDFQRTDLPHLPDTALSRLLQQTPVNWLSLPQTPPHCHLLTTKDDIAPLLSHLNQPQAPWVLMTEARADRLCQALNKQLAQLRMGDPNLDRRVQCGPLATPQHMTNFLTQPTTAAVLTVWRGQGRLSRDSKPEPFVGDPDRGLYVWPTLRRFNSPEEALLSPVLPGPALNLLICSDDEQANALFSRFTGHPHRVC